MKMMPLKNMISLLAFLFKKFFTMIRSSRSKEIRRNKSRNVSMKQRKIIKLKISKNEINELKMLVKKIEILMMSPKNLA